MTRLGSKMPFAQAVEEIWFGEKVHIEESVLRQITYRHGQAAEALARAEAERLETAMTAAPARPKQVLVSADGAFIHLTNGEWREVKTMVVGEFESVWNGKKGKSRSRRATFLTFPAATGYGSLNGMRWLNCTGVVSITPNRWSPPRRFCR